METEPNMNIDIYHAIPRLETKESPRQILEEDFPKHKWPISGGWGYDKDHMVVIELDNEWDGVSFEQKFIEYRTYEELIIFRPKNQRFAGINVQKGEQSRMAINGKECDKICYNVTAFSELEFEALRAEWEEHNGYEDDEEGRKRHLAKAEALKKSYKTVGYFDISRFFGKQ